MEEVNLLEIVNRVKLRIVPIAVITILLVTLFAFIPVKSSYISSVGVKAELENVQSLKNQAPDDVLSGVSSEITYVQLSQIVNKYIYSQISSIPFQKAFLDKINLPAPLGIDKKLIYSVVEGAAPYVFINYNAGSLEDAKKANSELKNLLTNELPANWNEGKNDKYKIKIYVLPETVIIEQPVTKVQKIIPGIIISVIMILICLLIPIKKKNSN